MLNTHHDTHPNTLSGTQPRTVSGTHFSSLLDNQNRTYTHTGTTPHRTAYISTATFPVVAPITKSKIVELVDVREPRRLGLELAR